MLAFCLTLLPTSALAEGPGALDGEIVEAPISKDAEKSGGSDNDAEEQSAEPGTLAPFNLETGDATEENAAAVINDTDYYSSFDAAYAAAKNGDTIQLRQDTNKQSTDDNRITVAKDQSLTIDLNGHELYRYITVNGTLTLKGSAGSTVLRDITVLGTLVVTDSVQTEAQTTLTLGSAEQGGTLDVQSDSAYIGAVVRVINKGDTALSHGQFTKFAIEQADTRIIDLLAVGYAFSNKSSGVWNANKTSKEFNDGYVVSVKTHNHSFSNENTYDCKCGYHCEHNLDPNTGACRNCHTQFKKARIGNEFYNSLSDALTAAAEQENCTVTLLCDTAASLTANGGSFTIDLDGHTWETSQSAALTIQGSADLTVQNGTIKSTSGAQFGAAIKLDGGSLTVGRQLICRGTYGIYIGSNNGITLANDTVLIGGVCFLAYGKAPADLLPADTAFRECSLNENGTVQIGEGYITNAYTVGSIHADMAVVPHTHDFGTGTCVCGLTAAAEVNGKIYQTLASAIEAANGDTVKLLAGEAGSGESITVAAGKTVTIDLNSKTLAAPITVLGTLRLNQSDSDSYGKANDLIIGNDEAAGALELLSDHIRVVKLTANQTEGIELDKGQFHAVYCPEGAALLSVLAEGYAFQGRTWNQNSFANQATDIYNEVVKCDHPSSIWSGAPVSAFENYHCKYCNYACPHDKGFHYDYDKGLVCSICGFSAAAYVAIGDSTGESFASLSDAVDFANSNAASTDKLITLQLHSSLYGQFTTTGRWTLDFKSYTLTGSTIIVGSDTTSGNLTLRNDYGDVAAGTVTVTSGSSLRTTKAEYGNGQIVFTSLTVQDGASASLNIGSFYTIKNEGGKLSDLLPSSFYAFEQANGTLINAYKESEAGNVTLVRHTHNINPETNTCACGYVCKHSDGYLNGVCKTCGMHCLHPLDQIDHEKNECNICHASLLATMTPEGGTTAYFSDLAYAFRCAPENGSATVTLLQDAMLFGVNTDQYYGTLGKILIGNAEAINGRTVTLDMNGHALTSYGDVIAVGSENENEAPSKLILAGTGDLIKQDSSSSACIEVLPTGTFVTDGWNSRIDHLLIKNGKVQLSGGTFGKIYNNGDAVKLGDLLADGYAFHDFTGEPISRSNGISANGAMGNIAVARCVKHAADSANDPCIYCGATDFTAQVVIDGKTTYYTDLSAALAKASTDGGTITLMKDVTGLTKTLEIVNEKDLDITLDLNGKTLSGAGSRGSTLLLIDTYGNVTIRDRGTTGKIESTNPGDCAVCVSSGKLTIEGGTFQGTPHEQGYEYALKIDSTDLSTITGGTFSSPVTVSGRLNVTGGSFTSLSTLNGTALSTLLVNGYTFKTIGENSKWLTESELAQTTAANVTAVEAPIHSLRLKANKTSVEYGQSGDVKLNFDYERVGGPDVNKYVTTTWYQVKDGVPKELYNTSVSYTLPAKLEAGKYTYRITIKDNDSGYTVSSDDLTITVTQIDLSKAELTFTQAADDNGKKGNIGSEDGTFVVLPFGGFTDKLSPLTYYFTVSRNGAQLKEGTDYRIVSGNEQKNAGIHEIKIEGLGNYTGTATTTWEIKPYTLSANSGNVSISPIIKTYDGTTAFTLPEDFSLAVLEDVDKLGTVNPGLGASGIGCEIRLTKGTDYTISDITFDSAEAGNRTATFTITLNTDNFVFEGNKKELKVTLNASGGINVCIDKADVEMTEDAKTVTQEITNDLAYTYTIDLPKLPELKSPKTYGDITYSLPVVQIDTDYYKPGNAEVKDGKLILSIDKNPVTTTGRIGTVTVTVSSTNYKDVTFIVNLEAVNKLTPTVFVYPSTTTITYGMTLADITLKAEAYNVTTSVPGTIVWDAPNTKPDAGKDQEFGWTFTPNDRNAYRSVSGKVRITVEPANLTGQPTFTKITQSGKTLADAVLTANESWPKGTFQWVDKDGKALADTTEVKANTAYQWKFTPESSNYNPIEGSITLYSVSTGGGSSSGSSSSNTVSAPSKPDNGSVSTDKSTAKKSDTVTITVKPDAGYTVGSVTVKDAKGNTITVTDKGNGKFTFVMPDTKVTITPNFVADQPAGTGYADVASSAWYSDAIRYVTDKGLMNGTGSDKFSPSGLTTRGMIMTILARNAGVDTNGGSAWYEKGMNWAKANGISDGTKPNANITREQLVAMLYRYAGSPKASGSLSDFSDSASVSSYAVNAMQWAVANGIVNGANGKLNPKNNATRAEVAAILMRFCEISK